MINIFIIAFILGLLTKYFIKGRNNPCTKIYEKDGICYKIKLEQVI